ncbi:hypothetical protein DIURU_000612 [Diutina rugosa]|uniref:DASH complex subunit DAD3 n=1 Tax=Diutina rugosa TaxID=5481 RepID=A0A642V2A8_DIURU|nr:uncharacterized protein DIURU_000612 [Diutina rugosa]KAA8907292.1 hypothetical protein DIURU_000612 [Diutina rugosa]
MSIVDADLSQYNVSADELELLEQYQLMARQLRQLEAQLTEMEGTVAEPGNPRILADNMRGLEMKMGVMHAFFKSSVYSVLRQARDEARNP